MCNVQRWNRNRVVGTEESIGSIDQLSKETEHKTMQFQWKNIKWQCYWKLLRLQCWNLSIPSMVSTNQITSLFISNMGGIALKYLKIFKSWFIILCTLLNTFMIYTVGYIMFFLTKNY